MWKASLVGSSLSPKSDNVVLSRKNLSPISEILPVSTRPSLSSAIITNVPVVSTPDSNNILAFWSVKLASLALSVILELRVVINVSCLKSPSEPSTPSSNFITLRDEEVPSKSKSEPSSSMISTFSGVRAIPPIPEWFLQ